MWVYTSIFKGFTEIRYNERLKLSSCNTFSLHWERAESGLSMQYSDHPLGERTGFTLHLQQINKQTRLTAVSFLLHEQLTATHTCYIYGGDQDTLHTHTRTRRPEVAVNFCSAFNPSRIVPPPGSSRSSGQLLSARGPIEPSVSVRDGQDCSVLFACFSVGVLSGGNPL